MVVKKHSEKADQSALASGGSEHALLFGVAINWNSKMNFSLCANMLGFCSDSCICYHRHICNWYSTMGNLIQLKDLHSSSVGAKLKVVRQNFMGSSLKVL